MSAGRKDRFRGRQADSRLLESFAAEIDCRSKDDMAGDVRALCGSAIYRSSGMPLACVAEKECGGRERQMCGGDEV